MVIGVAEERRLDDAEEEEGVVHVVDVSAPLPTQEHLPPDGKRGERKDRYRDGGRGR
jgi:hypothetical protein